MSDQQQPKPGTEQKQAPADTEKIKAPEVKKELKPGEVDGLPEIHIYFDKPGNLKMDFKNANIYTIIGMLEASRKRLVGTIGSGPSNQPIVKKSEGGAVADGAKA